MGDVRIRKPNRRGGSQRILLPSSFRTSPTFHLHSHSEFSHKDALPSVPEKVARAVELGHPALALTDHGNMGGAVQLYQECRERDIKPYPGLEAYFVKDVKKYRDKNNKGKLQRYHMGFVALDNGGYESLVRLSTKSHSTSNFHHKPHVDMHDLSEWADRGWTQSLALTTGCYFGYVVQTLVQRGERACSRVIETLAKWFPHTYVELQRHDIDHDDGWDDIAITKSLYDIAFGIGLPVVITQDAHYCHEGDRPYHDAMKRMVSWGDDPDDAVFPGDGFHMCDRQWFEDRYPEEMMEAADEGWKDILEHEVVIPELEEYHYRVPSIVADPLEELSLRCVDRGIELGLLHGAGGKTTRYDKRLEEELAVIEDTGFAGYMVLVAEFCDWLRDSDIFYLARGSASGSLVCYLLDITQLDPLKWKLKFERFLSRDRTKPPDIDLDVEKFRRDEALAYLDQRFTTLHIGTISTLGINPPGHPEEGRGSLVAAYNSYRKRKLEAKGKKAEYLATIKAVRSFEPQDAKLLQVLDSYEPKSSAGKHAAGLVVAGTRDELERLVPTMYIPSSKSTVSQYTMDDVEALGLVKLDVLGVRTLSAVKEALELVGDGTTLQTIPLDDSKVYTMLRQGNTAGVFQMEGWASTKGCREMRVKNIHDLILVNALYRPATLQTGVTHSFIQRRAGWEKVTYPHELLEKHTKETHGLTVFQEQVIGILRDLGFDPDELTEFLKAVKLSNKKVAKAERVVAKYAELYHDLATDVGFTDEARKQLWQDIEGFSDYSFNRAHATSYGVLGGQTGWLKKHHPLEYATSLLRTARDTAPKEKKYIKDVRREAGFGFKLLRPDINISDAFWSIDHKRGAIRKGLMSIKGIGETTALELAEHAPYDSIDDIIERTDSRKVSGGKTFVNSGDPDDLNGILGRLRDAGALRSLGI